MLMILGTAEWLLGKEKATLGQVAFFCANFHRHYIGQERIWPLESARPKRALMRELAKLSFTS